MEAESRAEPQSETGTVEAGRPATRVIIVPELSPERTSSK